MNGTTEDHHARLIGRALNYLRYLNDILEEAKGHGLELTLNGWHDVPRETFDAAGDDGCELIEWRNSRADGKVYWSKRVRGFDLYTLDPPKARSRAPDVVKTAVPIQLEGMSK